MSLIRRIRTKIRFILSTNHRLARVMTFKEYSNSCRHSCSYHLIETNRRTTVIPVQFVGDDKVMPFECSLPETYWVELHDGRVIGGSSVILSNDGSLLYDMLSERELYKANMTDEGLFLIGGRPRHFGEYYIYNYLNSSVTEIPTAITLACNMSNNYYHFMMEVAAKFTLLNQIGIDKDVPLLIDEQVISVPQMKEVIDALNDDNKEIIPLKKNQLYKVNKLFVISEPNVIVPNSSVVGESRTENFAFDSKAISSLRDSISSKYPLVDKGTIPERIFLSRKGCNKRRCNEDELEPILQDYGFKSIQAEELSIGQQIQLFSNAEHIIGSSGAAFTNLIYCKQNAIATLFFTVKVNATCFSSLGIVQGITTYHIVTEQESNNIHNESFSISPENLRSHLKSIYD